MYGNVLSPNILENIGPKLVVKFSCQFLANKIQKKLVINFRKFSVNFPQKTVLSFVSFEIKNKGPRKIFFFFNPWLPVNNLNILWDVKTKLHEHFPLKNEKIFAIFFINFLECDKFSRIIITCWLSRCLHCVNADIDTTINHCIKMSPRFLTFLTYFLFSLNSFCFDFADLLHDIVIPAHRLTNI